MACLAVVAVGCGGDDNVNGDNKAPAAEVAFPPPSSLTDSTEITVRGRASDPDGIAAVRVNGQLATTDNEFADWQTTVTLTHGSNAVTVETEDALGFIDEQAVQFDIVLSANWLQTPTAVVADTANGRALVLDKILDALLSVDYDTGERVIVSADGVGAGPRLRDPSALALDAAGGRALVLDAQIGALISVDLTTGDRTALSDDATGAGPAFNQPFAVTADLTAGRAWILDVDETDPLNPVPVIYDVDLATGDRTAVVDIGTGLLLALAEPTALTVDVARQQLYVTDLDLTDPLAPVPAVFQVDIATGALAVLSGLDPVVLDDPTAITFDAAVDENTLFVLDAGTDSVIGVDILTGVRTVLSADGVNSGAQLSVPVSITVEPIGAGAARAVVVDTGIDEVIAVDLDTGDRTVVSGVAIGAGPALTLPSAVALDAGAGAAGRAVIFDQGDEVVIAVDLASGARTVISGDGAGNGAGFVAPASLTLDVALGLIEPDQAARRAFVIDEGAGAIVSVDLNSGARAELSGPQAGSGTELVAPRGAAFLAGDVEAATVDQLIVADEGLGALVSVDVASGARAVVTDGLGEPQAVTPAFDEIGFTGDVLAVDSNPPALLQVGLDGGAQTELSGASVGDGTPLEDPQSVVVELERISPPIEPVEGEPAPPVFAPTGFALVVHGGDVPLLAIDLETGRRTELSSVAAGRGPLLDQPRALALDPTNERLLVVDDGIRGVLMVDLQTSERVLVSR